MDCHSLFFDAASKWKPGLSGVGGVIFYPGGTNKRYFAWGLGRSTNNQAEWPALLKGLEIAITLEIQDLVVFDDLLLVIREARKLAKNYKRPSNKLHHIFNSLIGEFNAVHFLHILRSNNQSADQVANIGVQLDYGFMICNGNNPEHCWVP